MKPLAVLALIAGILSVGCTMNITSDAPPPVLVSITQGVTTCGDVIRAAIAEPLCNRERGVCYAVAEYNPTTPTENVVSRGVLGTFDEITSVAPITDRPNRVEGGLHWHAYTILTSDLTLLTLGDTSVAGIGPDLQADLSLITRNTEPCADAPIPALIIQAQGENTALTINGVQFTVGRTLLVRADDESLRAYALDETSTASASGVTRVLRGGEGTTISLTDGEPDEPAAPTAFRATALTGIPLDTLPLPVAFEELSFEVQQERVQSGDDCQPRSDWTGQYLVQRGDSLVRIAPQFDVTVQQLQVGNCLQNPNRLDVGQALRVPSGSADAPTQSPVTPTSSTIIPAVNELFTVIPSGTIDIGACATLRWNLPDGTSAQLNGEDVASTGEREVCPEVTTVYLLNILNPDGSTDILNRSIVVVGN